MRAKVIVESGLVRKTEEVFQGDSMLKINFRELTKVRIASHNDEEIDSREVFLVSKTA